MQWAIYSAKLAFSSKFLLDNGDVQWADLLWMYSNGIISWRVPIDFAKDKFQSDMIYDDLIYELSNRDKDRNWQVQDLLEELSKRAIRAGGN